MERTRAEEYNRVRKRRERERDQKDSDGEKKNTVQNNKGNQAYCEQECWIF